MITTAVSHGTCFFWITLLLGEDKFVFPACLLVFDTPNAIMYTKKIRVSIVLVGNENASVLVAGETAARSNNNLQSTLEEVDFKWVSNSR